VRGLIAQLARAFATIAGAAERAGALDAASRAELAATLPGGRAAVAVLYLIWRAPRG
jgi:hypothetical protein